MQHKSFTRSHLFGFLLLVPFLVMRGVHSLFDLPNDLMVQAEGSEGARVFNFVMVAVFYCGAFAFIFHAFRYAPRSERWLLAKFVALIIYWGAIRLVAP